MTEFYIHSEAQPREFVDSVDVGFGRRRTALRMAPIFLPDQMEESMKTGEIISGVGRTINSSSVILRCLLDIPVVRLGRQQNI